VNRGDCYRATGKVDVAMSDFHRAYDSDPNNWETKTRLSLIHHMAGLQLFNERQYQQAEVELTIAIK
jgi:tetratricopeptide (TPR) repeat protein